MESNSEDVRLSFRRSGGLLGKALPTVELGASELSPEEAAAWGDVAQSGILEQGAPEVATRGVGGDEYQYDLVVRRGDEEHALRFSEFSAPPELAELIRLLEERAEQAEREGHTRSDPEPEGR